MQGIINSTITPTLQAGGIDGFINDAMGTTLVTASEANQTIQYFMATHPNAWLVTRTEMYVIVLGVLFMGVLVGYASHWYRIKRQVKRYKMAREQGQGPRAAIKGQDRE